jgi:hypothetical protein
MTTQNEISQWFDRGVKKGATHMIVVCDTFDYEDYPVYVFPEDDVDKLYDTHNENMQKVMEVYNLKMNKDVQLKECRAFNFLTKEE